MSEDKSKLAVIALAAMFAGFLLGGAVISILNYDKLYGEEDFSSSLVAVCDQNSGECQTLNVGNRLLIHEQALENHRSVMINHEERLQNIEGLIRQSTQEARE